MKMKLIILGPQGSGKGTQARKIAERFGIPHISTGDIFRKNIMLKTELGKVAEEIINKGELVPDGLTYDLVKKRLLEQDCRKGYILDGFPRNLAQAKVLEEFSETDYALDVDITDEEAVSRISGRRSCKNGHVYHVTINPPEKEGICDIDGEPLFQRDDDKAEVIKKRLGVYHDKTKQVIDFYKEKGKLIEINGMQPIEKVFSDIIAKLS